MKSKILIIDDDQSLCHSLSTLFKEKGFDTRQVFDGGSALSMIKARGERGFRPDIALVDYQLPDTNGIKLLEEIKNHSPETCVIIITGFGTVSQSVDAMHKGAFDYILKPFNINELLLRVNKGLEERSLKTQVTYLSDKLYGEWESKYVIGPNKGMKDLFAKLDIIANSNSTTVFIHGETGTGKEVIAQRIHFFSNRRNKPFVEINATALSAELLESELFGHEAGAFTGAIQAKKGLFEVASGGTLFLDEIGDMDLRMQAKILRALEERAIRRVGGTENIEIDIRLITATNKNLEEAVTKGEFREDLYYRLNVVPIYLPPLRERKDDLELLVNRFIEIYATEFSKPVPKVSTEALQAIIDYDWPGNIRELRNFIERTILLECNDSVLQLQHLKFRATPFGSKSAGKEQGKGEGQQISGGKIGTRVPLEEIEREHIAGVMRETGGNKNQCAQILGIDRTTLYNKLKKYEIS
jgi:two-component system response regulator AtoC